MNAKQRISLQEIEIAKPCQASWDKMVGDDQVRHCSLCHKNVYNLSAMSEAEALELLQEKEGNLCVRLYKRADGTVITSDCPSRREASPLRSITLLAAASWLALGTAPSMAQPPQPLHLLGEPATRLMGAPAASNAAEPRMIMGKPAAPSLELQQQNSNDAHRNPERKESVEKSGEGETKKTKP